MEELCKNIISKLFVDYCDELIQRPSGEIDRTLSDNYLKKGNGIKLFPLNCEFFLVSCEKK